MFRSSVGLCVIHCDERKTNKKNQTKSPPPHSSPPSHLHFVPGTVGVTRASFSAILEDTVEDLSSLLIFQAEQIEPAFDAAVFVI